MGLNTSLRQPHGTRAKLRVFLCWAISNYFVSFSHTYRSRGPQHHGQHEDSARVVPQARRVTRISFAGARWHFFFFRTSVSWSFALRSLTSEVTEEEPVPRPSTNSLFPRPALAGLKLRFQELASKGGVMESQGRSASPLRC